MTDTYDIRQHLAVLTPSKGSKTKYHCPVTDCNGSNLDISKDGAYSCFSGGCESKDIRAAIDKLEGKPEWKPEPFIKTVRQRSHHDYFYFDRQGNDLVRVTRIDDGEGGKDFFQNHWDGSKWEKGNPDEVKELIPIYRYAEVQQAIERKELIFQVEGEATADLLWNLGIAATTTIGGSGAYSSYGHYQEDLKGARLVLAPDRDDKGIKYIANIERDFPSQIEGYYLAGTLGLWKKPEGAMDIGDDIRDLGFSKGQILEKVITCSDYYQATLPKSPCDPNAGSHGDNDQEIKIDKIEIDKILTAKRHRLSPHDILPESIANRIEQISRARGTNPEPLILGQLVAVSSVPHANTRLKIGNYGDVLSVYPNLFGMAVGDSGSLKSPTIGTSFTKPLRALQTTYLDRYESDVTQYKTDLTTWESSDKKERKGEEPTPPRLTVVMAEDATMEKIEDLALHQPNICPAIYRDELIGVFQAFDKHGGKGANDSRAKLLSYYDGSPINIHRVGTGSKISKHDYHPVVFGGIQPEVLKELAQSIGMDNDGTLCRFLYAPIYRTYKPWDTDPDTDRIDTDTFSTLIKKVHGLPAIECSLDHAGQRAWAEIANYYNHECLNNPLLSQWLKHAYSKAIGQLGKIALTLHLIECASTDRISGIISAETINRAAIALDYFISQAIALVASTEESLESHLVKILAKATELGSITPREVSRCFSSKQRPNSVTAKNYLGQLASGGYGIFSDGIFTPSVIDSVDVTTCPRMSPTLGHDEPSSSKGFNNNVTNVTTIHQSNILLDMNDHSTTSNLYPSTELVTLVTSTPENQSGSNEEGVPELVTFAGTLVTLVTSAGTLVPIPLKVGDKVNYSGGMLKYKGMAGKVTKVCGEDRCKVDFVKSPNETIPRDELEVA